MELKKWLKSPQGILQVVSYAPNFCPSFSYADRMYWMYWRHSSSPNSEEQTSRVVKVVVQPLAHSSSNWMTLLLDYYSHAERKISHTKWLNLLKKYYVTCQADPQHLSMGLVPNSDDSAGTRWVTWIYLNLFLPRTFFQKISRLNKPTTKTYRQDNCQFTRKCRCGCMVVAGLV